MDISVTKNIIQFDFKKEVHLCKAMLRFQEHYESPNPQFRGQIFTLGMYRKWYSEKEGSFSYYSDWGGFNWPDYVLDAFLEGLFDPLEEAEQDIVNTLRHIKKPFYVIGTSGNEAYEHEMAHALYYVNKRYRNWVNKELKDQTKLTALRRWLKNDYTEQVFVDEENAYMAADQSFLDDQDVTYPIDLAMKLHKKFEKTKDAFLNGK